MKFQGSASVALMVAISGSTLSAQHFEVASIRPIDPKRVEQECAKIQPGRRGGRGTEDPEHVRYSCEPLQWLVLEAFGFSDVEVFRMPNLEGKIEWTHFVDLMAVVPPGTTQDQYQTLLRDLLVERYHLKSHQETRAGDAYVLTSAGSGHKLNRHVANSTNGGLSTTSRGGSDGILNLPPVDGRVVATGNRSHWRMVGSNAAVPALAERIEGILHAPVIDRTGLQGAFDFEMDFDPGYGAASETGVTYAVLPTALRDQLGLTIQKTKEKMRVVIIDSIDSQPTQN